MNVSERERERVVERDRQTDRQKESCVTSTAVLYL